MEIRAGDYYYIDKTGFIRDLLQESGKVTLFTRPRRFGKTLNMSMLKAFFEIGCSPEIFEGLEIFKETELCEKYMGKYPVLSITLKAWKRRTLRTPVPGCVLCLEKRRCVSSSCCRAAN